MELAELMSNILDDACPSSVGVTSNRYFVEVHCVTYWIDAIKKDGVWTIVNVNTEPN